MFGSRNSSLPLSPPDPTRLALRPEECQKITLPDMRDLGFAFYGSADPSDPMIFLFHGMPGSRIVGRSWDKLCKEIGARLVAIDRPGCGLSTLADRGLTDWHKDVVALADHLRVKQFSVIGASGGGPFALACAHFIPKERLRSTTVVCGIGPVESLTSWQLYGITSWILRVVARYIVLPSIMSPYLTKDPARLKRVLEDQCKTPEEKEMISNDNESDTNLDDTVAQFLEAFKQGTGGCIQDGTVLARNWGFDLREVDKEGVWLVHGDQDTHAPVGMAQWIDERLGGGTLKVLHGKTHFTIWKDHSEEIFRRSAGVEKVLEA